ncbi:hypothetical protein HUO13_04305 [Saccharopolyspora erythraea]|uniref:hypothetical protein n=1 Tax=Saccharopolyspora erythraea TaxID=1836 RepID=UPI001BA7DBF1|nr:hypothetical protein [Saccharopolyspora erythraea]QUH00138.1 hypothetical protein HUO13_04305 [Saccharopolyspora erythraea]
MGWGLDYVRDIAEKAWDAGGDAVEGLKRTAASTTAEFDDAVDWVERQMTPQIRAEACGGNDIYKMFHGGPGTESMDEAAGQWGGVAGHHREAAEAVSSAMARMRASGQGETAGAGAGALRQEHLGEDADSVRAALEAQSEGFNDAKRHVVYVPPEPPTMSITAPINPFAPIDYASEVSKYFAAQAANQRVLHGYGALTADVGARLPAFDGKPVRAGDTAVSVSEVGDVRAVRDPGRASTEDAGSAEPPARTQSAWRSADPPGAADDVNDAGAAATGGAFGAGASRSADRGTGRRGLFGGRFGGRGNGRGAGGGGLPGLRGRGAPPVFGDWKRKKGESDGDAN